MPGENSERGLTTGEITLARQIYKTSIDYQKVRVHDGKYIFFQPSNSGMTPNGEIYVDGIYRSDYSSAVPRLKSFFIHEMAHVYQYQLKILNPITAAISEAVQHGFNYDKAYQYMLDAKKDLLDYDIEQQAQVIEDYYRVHYLGLNPIAGFIQNNVTEAKTKGLYSKVLSKFLRDPNYARHKLECQWTRRGSTRRRICTRVIVK